MILLVAPTIAYKWHDQLASTQDDWQKYVRSPAYKVVRPAHVLGDYTRGNVTNPNGLLTGMGATILSRNASNENTTAAGTDPSDVAPAVVVDWGQNIVGFLSINFGESFNTTAGLPGIRLAFSETLQFLGDLSDFSRSDNVSASSPNMTKANRSGRNDHTRKRPGNTRLHLLQIC